MGFFSELKEDLSQAVNELVSEEEVLAPETMEEAAESEISRNFVPETAEELGRMLDNMDLSTLDQPETGSVEQIAENEPEELSAEEESYEEIITEQEEETKVREEEIQVEETQYNEMETTDSGVTGDVVDEMAVITEGMTVRGDISSRGSLNIIGSVEGNIDILGKLNITGGIEGSSKAADVYAEKARINGDIQSAGSIKIGQSTIIIGNIFASSAVIAGAVKGDIDVKGPVILDTSAIVMGNIKSKSVQINNGAVIEGLCSQCYADVNPSSFFEDIKKARK